MWLMIDKKLGIVKYLRKYDAKYVRKIFLKIESYFLKFLKTSKNFFRI